MLYSVWDGVNKVYDYYQTPGTQADLDTPIPNHLKRAMSTPIGVGSDVAWPLPQGAIKVGSGPLAKGSIAKIGGGSALGALEVGGSFIMWLIGGAIVYWLVR